ncbi:MAG: TetR family transcriptional regulator [Acidimicrobiia bacterium]|nr:TetR family transcriptional regulator [Acidimicrobiia bacterium]
MTTDGGLRQRKKEQTRQRIETAALELFSRDGFDAATIDDIAAAADIAPRTFFHYFPTKEDVVLADYAGRLEKLVTEVDSRPDEEDHWTALRRSFAVVASDYQQQRDHLMGRFGIMAGSPSVQARSLQLQAQWEDALAASLTRRRGDDPNEDLSSRLLAATALAAMRSSLRHWLISGHALPLPTVLDACFDQLGAGLDRT